MKRLVVFALLGLVLCAPALKAEVVSTTVRATVINWVDENPSERTVYIPGCGTDVANGAGIAELVCNFEDDTWHKVVVKKGGGFRKYTTWALFSGGVLELLLGSDPLAGGTNRTFLWRAWGRGNAQYEGLKGWAKGFTPEVVIIDRHVEFIEQGGTTVMRFTTPVSQSRINEVKEVAKTDVELLTGGDINITNGKISVNSQYHQGDIIPGFPFEEGTVHALFFDTDVGVNSYTQGVFDFPGVLTATQVFLQLSADSSHEFGHAFGMQHPEGYDVLAWDSVMGYADWPTELDQFHGRFVRMYRAVGNRKPDKDPNPNSQEFDENGVYTNYGPGARFLAVSICGERGMSFTMEIPRDLRVLPPINP